MISLEELRQMEISREEVAVVVSGIVSMGLEIQAGRVIAPEFGSTIYTWGSIIGVSMLALSLGYHYGGKKSSQIRGKEDLEKFLIYTSAYIIFIMFAGEVILNFSASLPIDPIYSPIVPVTLLFGPPTYFLGYVSPYAAQLCSKETKGEASGHFYAIGTAGSIAGAFGTTFILIPTLPADYIYLFFAVIASLPLIDGLGQKKSYFFILVLLLGVAASEGAISGENVVYQDSTAYQDLKVTREGNLTTLYLDNHPQSAKYLNSTESPWKYIDYFYLPFLMREDVEDVLLIGGGGFVVPQQFEERGLNVDVVELDPGVVKAAKMYFNLSESENLSVYVTDGREYLENTSKEYDVVYMDAFRKDKVPFHLTTREFFSLAHEKTDENGIVASNVISTSSGPGAKFVKSYYRTLGKEFRSMYFFPTRNTSFAQNIIVIGSKGDKLSKEQLKARENRSKLNLSEEVGMMRDISTENAQILTDDYAPVEKLLNPLLGKKYVVD